GPVLFALEELGPAASPAVPDLVLTLRNNSPAVGRRVCDVLVRIGPASVTALDATLQDRGHVHRAAAAWALAQLGPEAREAVPTLAKALSDRDRKLALLAADALAAMGDHARAA